MKIDFNGYVREERNSYVHRNIAEKVLGRKLKQTEQVHHIDYNKSNNVNTNLIICPSNSYHRLLHARQDCINDGFNPDIYNYCSFHKRYELKKEFSFRNTWNSLHNMCREGTNLYRKQKGLNTNKFNWKARLDQQFRRAIKKGIVSCLSKEGSSL